MLEEKDRLKFPKGGATSGHISDSFAIIPQ